MQPPTAASTRRVEADPSLRRVERDAAIACAVMATVALGLQQGQPGGALGVIGGGALMAFSFRAIRRGVDVVVLRALPPAADGSPPPAPGGVTWPLLRFILRYVVIAVGAWILLVKLRAHPVGVVAGVTAPVVAIAIEAWRLQRR